MKFKCKKCGSCCRNLRDKNTDFVGLPLFEWEAKELKKLAKERGIKINIEPADIVFEEKSKLYPCAKFLLKQESCPFLLNDKCTIYSKAPIVCKAFPLQKNPLISKNECDFSAFIECKNFDFRKFFKSSFNLSEGDEYRISREKITSEYLKTFGEEILVYATIQGLINSYIIQSITHLIKEGKIKLTSISSTDTKKYPVTPFFEFLKKAGICDEKAKKDLIKELTNYDKVKQIIKKLEQN